MSESKTERMFEKIMNFQELGGDKNFIIEYQTSSDGQIRSSLTGGSKTKKGGMGKPEHIIRHKNYPDLLILTEGKKDVTKHESVDLGSPTEFAVDGVKKYSESASKHFDVISIAFSGSKEDEIRISWFFQPKNGIFTPIKTNDKSIISVIENFYVKSEVRYSQDYHNLQQYLSNLNNQLHSNKILEMERSFFISAVLISLDNENFRKTYLDYNEDISSFLFDSVREILVEKNLTTHQVEKLMENIMFIKNNRFSMTDSLKTIVCDIEKNVKRYVETYQYNDILMDFHNQTLQYANNEKGLGIVLTPHHQTDFLVDILGINENSIFLDSCAGTSGFLISALKKMRTQNPTMSSEELSNRFIGVELQPHIWALSMFNFILHGITPKFTISGDSFNEVIKENIKKLKPNVGFQNPPYKADKKNDKEELEFVLNQLDLMEINSLSAFILPMSSALNPNKKITELKRKLMEKHTLIAVFSNPDELFYNTTAGVVTCTMIIKVGVPHKKNLKTFFGYFKDDGFEKRKNIGRTDVRKKWSQIKEKWVNSFINGEEHFGFSVKKCVSHSDDWCAEAHLTTDISKLTPNDFKKDVRNYLSFLIKENRFDMFDSYRNSLLRKSEKDLKLVEWKEFEIGELFDVKKGKRLTKSDMEEGDTPFISSSEFFNGLTNRINKPAIFQKNTLTVNYDGSVGESFYQPFDFWALDSCNVLIPKIKFDVKVGLFISTIIRNEKYRFNYGRKWTSTIMKKSPIFLPIDKDNKINFDFIIDFMDNMDF